MITDPGRITLVNGLTILQKHLTPDEAKSRLRQAFVQKDFSQSPFFAFSYDDAAINWDTGLVKIGRKREPFCPTFSRVDFFAYFFGKEADADHASDSRPPFNDWTQGFTP